MSAGGHDLAFPVSDPDHVLLADTVGLALVPSTAPGCQNTHFRACTPAGNRLFVKLIKDDQAHWRTAVEAAPLVEQLGIRTPRLLDHGEFTEKRWWLTYEWQDFTPFTATSESVHKAGEVLGFLHHVTSGMNLDGAFACPTLTAEIALRTTRLDELDPVAARRVRRLHSRFEYLGPLDAMCLTHGDVSWRNFGTGSDGETWLYDWEDATFGHPLMDFAKIVDGELADPIVRQTFLRGYHTYAATLSSWPDELRLVRLWSTANALAYGSCSALVA
jgi:Phosphotransferase enzyme family